MTTIELGENTIVADQQQFTADAVAEDSLDSALSAAFSITPEQFTALKVAERDLAVFLLVREMASTLLSMETRLNEYEEKAKDLASPEGIQRMMAQFMGGMGGKGGMNMGALLTGMMK